MATHAGLALDVGMATHAGLAEDPFTNGFLVHSVLNMKEETHSRMSCS